MATFSISSAPVTHPEEGPVRHLFALRFKAGTTAEQVQTVEKAFRSLPAEISLIQSLEAGVNSSPEQHDHGFTHLWLFTFRNGHERDTYLQDPKRQEVRDRFADWTEEVLVLDFVPRE